jgi:signal transduction histidine kinase/ActR/RegA family two-component response regulator
MRALQSLTGFRSLRRTRVDAATAALTPAGATWRTLPLVAQLYVAVVMVVGAAGLVVFFPHTLAQPLLFVVLLLFACMTSAWKVTLPIPVANGSTLSVSYAANLMSLLLLGAEPAVVIAVAGVWTQCRYKQRERYPLHRTVFSAAMAVITMVATSAAYSSLGGPSTPANFMGLAKPLVGAIGTYFLVNTSLVATAIALSTRRTFLNTWRDDFLWSGASYMVAGTAGAVAALVVRQGDPWKAVLLVAPIYLTYRTYELFAGRLEDQKRHTQEIQRLHHETVAALAQTRDTERALAAEKERLALALAEMTRLEEARNDLLEREQAARASAEHANRLKDEFLAVVSHELRTPLNAILGWSDMLCKSKLPDALRERASHGVSHSAKRQAQLIEDLLDVSRIASGKLRLEQTFIDLEDVVREALQVVQPSAEAKAITIGLDTDGSHGRVYGDGARLQQVAINLLSNAVKFTPAGGAIHVSVDRAGDTAEMIVTDTGQGIAPAFLPWVFDAFRQGDGSTTRIHSGLGLGLSIVKNLVEAHAGTVTAHSRGEGRGATFTVRLPIAECGEWGATSAIDRATPSREAIESGPSIEGMAVLVVDDDEESREVVAAHLHERHADVLTAASAAQALELLEHEHIDVLLADIGMPEVDGYGLIRRVRALQAPETASIPAAALTAFARDEDRLQALQAGFQLHLAKPIDERSLVAAVASLGKMSRTRPGDQRLVH